MASARTQFYHPARVIDATLHAVERSIRRAEGISLVVGPPGTGKTLVLAKVAEHVRDDFDVAFLSGARICTRRALWQSVLAAIGEPYQGIDEGDLRMAIVERIRGLAATGSGLVLLVDEAHTMPTRLLEELRLLTNVPTPLPAVHIVLAGSTKLDELLGLPRMESLAQRVAVRGYLEPLDHAETMAYLRTQTKAAGLDWDRLFEAGCDDAVFSSTDGVPRLVNQLCDQALVMAAAAGRRARPADVAAAWREIQRLPLPAGLDRAAAPAPAFGGHPEPGVDMGLDGMEMIEFGGLDDELPGDGGDGHLSAVGPAGSARNPWSGPEVELVFDAGGDPFEEIFRDEERVVERFVMRGPDDFSGCTHVSSREGQALARLLEAVECSPTKAVDERPTPPPAAWDEPAASGSRSVPQPAPAAVELADDDADMVVIEEDLAESEAAAGIVAVRPGDYRSLFTRLRRGR